MSAKLGRKENFALGMLVGARQAEPSTNDGIVSSETFYDREIHVAFVHWRTANSLRRKGYVTFGEWDPDWGTEIILADSRGAA